MSNPKKRHPWRLCPLGEHWVSEHSRGVPVPERNPTGETIVDGHCRKNPSHHEIFVPDEIVAISSKHFKNLSKLPSPDTLDFPNGKDFDILIGGWTQFWNEMFAPTTPLDPNLVKALAASESGFDIGAKANSKIGLAKGLIQITEQTRMILANQQGELKDFLITLSKNDVSDPNLNLFAGIRWLFHKQYLATRRLKREATWMEAIAEYKGILGQLGKFERSDRIMEKLDEYYKRLGRK